MQAQLNKLSFLFFIGCLCSCHSNSNSENIQAKNMTSLAPLGEFDATTMDGLLVSVADQAILLSDLQHSVVSASNGQTQLLPSGQLIGGGISIEDAKQLLQTLINQKVLQIKASELGIEVTDIDLTNRIDEFLKQQNFSTIDLTEQLKKSGKSMEDYRDEFRNEILKNELISRAIRPLVTVTKDEVNNYYLQQTGTVKQVTSVKLRSLMLNIPLNYEGDPLKMPLAQKVQTGIDEGTDFVELVKKYSTESSVAQTLGILPARPVAQLPQQLRDRLTQLKIKDIVGPIKIANAVFYFQYLGAEFANESDLKTNYSSWKNKLLNLKFQERLTEYLKNARTTLKINRRPFRLFR